VSQHLPKNRYPRVKAHITLNKPVKALKNRMLEAKKPISDMTDEEFEKFSEGEPKENKEGDGGENKEETPEEKEEREADEAKKKEEDDKKKAEEDAAADENNKGDKKKEKIREGEEPKEPPHVPYAKFQKKRGEWKKREKELETELEITKKQKEELEQAASSQNIEKDVDKFIEKTGMEKEAVMELISIIKKHAGVSPDVEKRITNFERTSAEAAEKAAFENDFEKNVLPLIKEANVDVTSAQIAKAKEKIKELAYQDGKEKIPLDYIFARHQKDLSGLIAKPEKKKSAEGSRPGSQAGAKPVEYENITAEQINNMTDAEFEKYSEWAEKTSGSKLKIMRNGEQVNN